MLPHTNRLMTHPLRTPRTRLSIKKDPRMMSGKKKIQLVEFPSASLVCNVRMKYRG